MFFFDVPRSTYFGTQSSVPNGAPPYEKTSLQAKIFKHLSVGEAVRSLAWRKLLGDRLCTLCPEEFEEPYILSEDHFRSVCRVLMTIGPGPRLLVIKTLINSWSTSSRMGESVVLPCLFCGQVEEDELCHYLSCDTFWTLLISSAGLKTVSLSLLSLSPSQRVGMLNPSKVCFKLLAGAFLVYHAIKIGHTVEIQNACSSGDFVPLQELTLSLADVHYRDSNLLDDVT